MRVFSLSSLPILLAVALGGALPQSPKSESSGAQVKDYCGCEYTTLPEVLALVNGVKITRHDLSLSVMARTAELQQEVIDARTGALDLQINSILLEAEAKRRGLSTTRLLKSEVTSKAPEPTEAEVQVFYNQNKGKIQGEFKDVKGILFYSCGPNASRNRRKNSPRPCELQPR